jgi:hypothetical protein
MCSRDFRSYEPMPPVDRMKSFILHIPIGTPEAAEVYGLNIAKGWAAAELAMDARRTRADARKGWMWSYSPGTPADAVAMRLRRATTLDELINGHLTALKAGVWSTQLEAIALTQYDIVRAGTAETREALAALWAELEPAGRWTEVVADVASARAAALAGEVAA